MSSLYHSGDTGTNRGTSLRRPFDARRRAQIRSDVLRQAAENLEQAQVEQRDPLSRDREGPATNVQAHWICPGITGQWNLTWQ
jgi:hypothetical protein